SISQSQPMEASRGNTAITVATSTAYDSGPAKALSIHGKDASRRVRLVMTSIARSIVAPVRKESSQARSPGMSGSSQANRNRRFAKRSAEEVTVSQGQAQRILPSQPPSAQAPNTRARRSGSSANERTFAKATPAIKPLART